MAYVPLVYNTSGGDVMVVSTGGVLNIAGGRLQIAGTDFITSGGNVKIGSLTSGNINTTGSVIATSGLTGSSGTFTNGVAASTGTFTGSIVASSGAFTNGITMSSAVVTNGFTASSGNFTNGLNASTGAFSGALTIGATLTMSSGTVRALEQPATGVANPYTITNYAITQIWSSGANSTAGRRYALPAPTAGLEKWITCNKAEAAVPAIVSATGSTCLFDKVSSILIFSTGATNVQWIHLLGENSTNWLTLSRSTDVTVSAT